MVSIIHSLYGLYYLYKETWPLWIQLKYPLQRYYRTFTYTLKNQDFSTPFRQSLAKDIKIPVVSEKCSYTFNSLNHPYPLLSHLTVENILYFKYSSEFQRQNTEKNPTNNAGLLAVLRNNNLRNTDFSLRGKPFFEVGNHFSLRRSWLIPPKVLHLMGKGRLSCSLLRSVDCDLRI